MEKTHDHTIKHTEHFMNENKQRRMIFEYFTYTFHYQWISIKIRCTLLFPPKDKKETKNCCGAQMLHYRRATDEMLWCAAATVFINKVATVQRTSGI